ncbi:MAG: oligosaccharide flippase family protein [Anaerolineae bacterium]|nr:oligosaccharide flippase family protein [Thermoflexales bacterium]MDW8407401.1 oligosaccharide flippase family protein [Anaerolineae bacterium]
MRIHPRLATLLCVMLLALLPFTLFLPVTVGDRSLIPFDNLYQWEPYRSQVPPGLERPQNHLLSDLILENYAWKQFIIQSLGQRELPLWNPYLFAGVPFLAAGQHSALYPFSALYYLLPLHKAYGWFTVLHLALAGLFMFVLMRTFGVGRAAATFAAVAYELSGFMIVSVVFQMIIAAATWLPLILAMCERVIRQWPALRGRATSAPWALIGAVAIGMMFLAGHVEIMVYTALITALYCVWQLISAYRREHPPSGANRFGRSAFVARRLGWLVVMAGLGVGIGAVQLVPLLELVQTSFRSARSDFQQVLSYGFPLREALRWIMPNFFGSEAHHTYFDLFTLTVQTVDTASGHTWWGMKNSVEGGAYVGILTLVFAGIAIAQAVRQLAARLLRQQRSGAPASPSAPIWFFIALAFFSVAFIFGTPLYAILYYGLPGINQLHSPFRWIWALTLCLAALAGLGVQTLIGACRPIDGTDQTPRSPSRKLGIPLGIVALVLIGVGLVVFALIALIRLNWPGFEPFIERAFKGLAKAEEGFTGARMFFSYQAVNAAIFALAAIGSGGVIWLARRHAGRIGWAALAIGLLVIDVNTAWAGFNPAVDPALFNVTPPAIAFFKQDTSLYRVTTYDPHGTKLLNANIPWLHSIQDVRGYDSIIPKRYTDYMSLIEPQGELLYNRIAPLTRAQSLESPLLDLLNVKYIVTQETLATPGLRLVYDGSAQGDPTRIYENTRALPRAFTLPITSSLLTHNFAEAVQTYDPRHYALIDADCGIQDVGCVVPYPGQHGPATITVYKNNEVWVDVQVDRPSWLILADSYFPGWRAFIRPLGESDAEEREIVIVPANGNFRAVRLEPTSAEAVGAQSSVSDRSEAPAPGLSKARPTLASDSTAGTPSAYTVRFKYSPTSFQIGLFATFVALATLLFMSVVYGWRQLYRDSAAASPVRRIAKNSLVLTGFNLGARLIDMAFALLMLRVLGPEGAGKYYFAVVIVGWFEILTNFGLNTFLTREVARDPQGANRYLYNTSVLRLLLSFSSAPLLGLLIAVWGAAFDLTGDTAIAIILLALGQIPGGLANGLSALFFAYEKAETPAALSIVSALIKVSLGTLALLGGFGIIGLALVSIVVNTITLIILLVVAGRLFFRPRREGDRVLRRVMLRESFPLMLNHLLATLFFKIDVPMLEAIQSPTVVGWYSAAYKFVDAFNIIPAFFTQSFFPIMSRLAAAQDDTALSRAYILALKLLVMIAFPLAVFTTYAAGLLVGVLGGTEFLPHGAIALSVMIWSIPFGWINSVTNYALIAVNQQRALTRAFIIGLTFNVVGNLIVIPQFSYVGAAIVTILSELVEGSAFYFYVRRHIAAVNWLDVLGRPALAALAMLGVTWLWAAGGLTALGLIYGVLAYVLVLWFMRALSAEEIKLLTPLLPARFRTILARQG